MRDIIIIGCGGGGPVVAKELAAKGLDVLVLESGRRFLNSEQELTPTDFVSFDHFYPGFVESRTRVFRYQVAGVGGTTLHYYGNSPRAMPQVFRESGADPTAFDVAHAFPFTYASLIPYYEWVEQTLPVQTAPMDTKSRIFLEAAQAVGLQLQTSKNIGDMDTFRPQENAILQPRGTAGSQTVLRHYDTHNPLRYPRAEGCTFCGYCQLGCTEPFGAPRNLKAKRSTDNSYVPMALTAGRWTNGRDIELIGDAHVQTILTERSGFSGIRAKGVRWRDKTSGQIYTEEANVIVLAAGVVESPRLWLNSGLPNPNGWVGRGYTDHYLDLVLGVLKEASNTSKGPSSNARIDMPSAGTIEVAGMTPALIAALAAQSQQGFADTQDTSLSGFESIGRIVGTDLRALLDNINRLFAIVVFTDDHVEYRNTISRSTLFHDADGPLARVEVRVRSKKTTANRDKLVSEALELMRVAGAPHVARMDATPVTIHPMSAMRMGDNIRDSVLDEYAESRWVERLFIADNSALSNALGGPNPTLTTQALATRSAEKIFQKYFGGDSWIERGDGFLSSIDPTVTQAVVAAEL
jgi:choline dehydrogenase-like flavoprotein